MLTGDSASEDMDKIRAFYNSMSGKFPELSGPIQLKEEQPPSE